MKQKTLIILSPGFAKDENDSTCLPPQQVFVKAFKKNAPSLQIIILAFQYPFFKKQYTWFGNIIISFNGQDKRGICRLLLWLKVYRKLNRLKKLYEIAGILSFWCTECALIGKIFSKKNSYKHFIWVLGQDAKPNNRYVKLIKPEPRELIALSDFIANAFANNHEIQPNYIIPVGIDSSMFNKTQPSKIIDIMGAGSLIPLKQYNIFLEVISEVRKTYPNIKAILCGEGNEDLKLKKMISELKLKKNILLTGKKSHSEVLQYMQQSKIFLHSSSFEGFGSVCLEALYAGAHVISFIQPMHASIPHWHIVKTKEEMIIKTLELLNNRATEYRSILPFSADDNVKAMMKLFEINPEVNEHD